MSEAYAVCSVNSLSKPQMIQCCRCFSLCHPHVFLPISLTSIQLKIPVSLVSILEYHSLNSETCIRQMRVNPGATLLCGVGSGLLRWARGVLISLRNKMELKLTLSSGCLDDYSLEMRAFFRGWRDGSQ